MIKITVQMQEVLQSLKNLLAASDDVSPALLKIKGPQGDREPYTVIGSIHRAFLTQGESLGVSWPDLTRYYQRRKTQKYGFKPMLVAEGSLFNSLVFEGPGNVRILEPMKLVFGTTIPYAVYHQSDEPRTKMPWRPFIRITEEMYDMWDKIVVQYLREMWTK